MGQTQMPFAVNRKKNAPDWPPIERDLVDSTSIVSVGYDEASRTMEIEFPKAAVYRYHDVSPKQHRALIEAPSIGTHFATEVRGKFPWFRVDIETGKEMAAAAGADKPATKAQRDYVYRLLGKCGYIDGFRSERCGAGMHETATICGAPLRGPSGAPMYVDDWLAALTAAQATKAIDHMKAMEQRS